MGMTFLTNQLIGGATNGISTGNPSAGTGSTGGFFSAGNMSSIAGGAGAVASMIGGISSAFAAYAQADSIKSNLQFQSDMAKINARMAENTAQSIMDAGKSQNAASTMKYGQMAATQKASQGARGVAMGEGSAAEEIASTNIIKEIDSNTINANTVRAAWSARTQGVNASNQAAMSAASTASRAKFGIRPVGRVCSGFSRK